MRGAFGPLPSVSRTRRHSKSLCAISPISLFVNQRGLSSIAILTLIATCVFARDPQSAKKTPLAVQVSGYDPALIDLVSTYIKDELRSLKDVALVDDEPMVYLRVMVIENKSRSETTGYTLSALVSSTIESAYLRNIVPDESQRGFLLRLYGTAEKLQDQWIVSAPASGLEETCRNIVATFYRTSYQQIMKPRLTVGEVIYSPPRSE